MDPVDNAIAAVGDNPKNVRRITVTMAAMTTYAYVHDEPCPQSGVEHTHEVTAIGERLPWCDPFLMADCARDSGAPWWCATHDRGVERCRVVAEALDRDVPDVDPADAEAAP
jgi:hypothetical protein